MPAESQSTDSPEKWVIDVDVHDFEQEVLLRSQKLPVLVDFWATWCEPCLLLGPQLEKAAKEGAGRFVLARVDVDKNPELAQAFRVQGIPMVIAFQDTRPVDGFQGALSDPELQAFLDRVAPGVSKGPLELAREELADGRAAEAVELARQVATQEPDNVEARVLLATALFETEQLEEAREILAALSEADREGDEARALQARLGFADSAGDLDELERAVRERPDDPGAHTALGKARIARGDHEGGLSELLEAVKLDIQHDGGAAKQAMLEAFEILGLEDPVANRFRYELSLHLFA